jgi:hypothetical protein
MKKLYATLTLLMGVCLLPSMAMAEGTVGSVFLLVGTDARCEGMGGACIATVKGSPAVSYNPAAMAESSGQSASFMHNETVLDLSQEYISYVSSYGGTAWGGSLIYYDMGSQQRYTTDNLSSGSFRPKSYAFTIGYGKQANKQVSWGLAAKYVKEEIDDAAGTAFALDAGLLYKPSNSNWRFAGVLSNFGTKIKVGSVSDPLPLTFKAGAAYTMPRMPLTLTTDAYFIKNADPEYHFGAEYLISNYIGVRAGYNSDDDLDNGFTFGLGFYQQQFGVDYAYIPMGVFGDSHRFTLSANF